MGVWGKSATTTMVYVMGNQLTIFFAVGSPTLLRWTDGSSPIWLDAWISSNLPFSTMMYYAKWSFIVDLLKVVIFNRKLSEGIQIWCFGNMLALPTMAMQDICHSYAKVAWGKGEQFFSHTHLQWYTHMSDYYVWTVSKHIPYGRIVVDISSMSEECSMALYWRRISLWGSDGICLPRRLRPNGGTILHLFYEMPWSSIELKHPMDFTSFNAFFPETVAKGSCL